MNDSSNQFLVAVHAGAGYHSSKHENEYREGLASACRAAAQALHAGGCALDAVAAALVALEDCEACNAGRGSNLTFSGIVECDASVMAGDGSFGAVGAVPGVSNPVKVARKLAEEQAQPLSHGRVRPMMLVGDQARVWALSRGIPAACSLQQAAEWNVTEAARSRWRRYRRMVDGDRGTDGGGPAATSTAAAQGGTGRGPAAAVGPAPGAPNGAAPSGNASCAPEAEGQQVKRARPTLPSDAPERHSQQQQQHHHHPGQQRRRQQQQQQPGHQRQRQDPGPRSRDGDSAGSSGAASLGSDSLALDTVGCVVVDQQGRVAAGVSSGGIALKAEGRVGEAALYGAGCWAQDRLAGRPAVACSVTGVGERIMQHLVARGCASHVVGGSGAGAEQGGDITVSGACSAVLQQSVLLGPPPRDCGVLCVRATATPGQPASAQSSGREGQAAEDEAAGGQLDVHVELGVAHCASSMAFGYMTRGMSHPRLSFLRNDPAAEQQRRRPGPHIREAARAEAANTGSTEGTTDVKTFTFGARWQCSKEWLCAQAELPVGLYC